MLREAVMRAKLTAAKLRDANAVHDADTVETVLKRTASNQQPVHATMVDASSQTEWDFVKRAPSSGRRKK